MADGQFNVCKGRSNELHDRVDGNDPANAVLVLVLLDAAEADGTLEDYDTLAAVLVPAGNVEATFTNYARIVLDDTDVSVSTVNDTTNVRVADITDPVYVSAGGAANNDLEKLVMCFDSDSTGGTDANIEPMHHFDFVITTNGSDITGTVAAGGYFSAA